MHGMKGVCAGHFQRTALVDSARIGAQNAILCWCNTTLEISGFMAHTTLGINIHPAHEN